VPEEADSSPPGRFVAGARRLNYNERLLGFVRGARERALGDDSHIDRLSTSRGRPSDLAARGLVDLRGDEPGLLGELGLTALQGWQRLAESQDRGRGKVDVAILFTDLVGFSSWALEAGDRDAVRLLRAVTETIEPPIERRQGEVVKRLGDGLMAVFWDAPAAVEAAFEIDARVAAIEVVDHRPQLRTGIHLGRPRRLGGDYLGVDVNIAARLTEAAKPGEVLVSERALERLPADSVRAKKRRFRAKGVPEDLDAFALAPAR